MVYSGIKWKTEYLSRRDRNQREKKDGKALVLIGLAFSFFLWGAGAKVIAEPAASGIQVVDTIEIHRPGDASSFTIPVYQVGNIRFISAGVGLEERQATYPPFPLKLVFAEESGAYVTGVSVTILDSDGKMVLEVPKDQVTGPWLFIDLPPGTYTVTGARDNQTQTQRNVRVKASETREVHLRWPKS